MTSQDTPHNAPEDIIVFDEIQDEPDEDSAQISLRFRQPSFTFLGVRSIPKGFQSLADFSAHGRGPSIRPSGSDGGIAECPVLNVLAPLTFGHGKSRRKTEADLH
jgi:hypothetical protein